jgi:hypothetical protein
LALTATKTGDWDGLGDLIGEALDEAEELASKRGLKLSKSEIVIYEVMGLKTFRARIGDLLEAKAKPGRPAKGFDLRLLKGPACVATGTGGAASVISIRRRVLDEMEKPGVKRPKGIETIRFSTATWTTRRPRSRSTGRAPPGVDRGRPRSYP